MTQAVVSIKTFRMSSFIFLSLQNVRIFSKITVVKGPKRIDANLCKYSSILRKATYFYDPRMKNHVCIALQVTRNWNVAYEQNYSQFF